MSTVRINIFFFGKARELSGKKEATLTVLSSISVYCLLNKIVNEFALRDIEQNVILALNEEYLSNNCDIVLRDNDTVAVIPPLSGG